MLKIATRHHDPEKIYDFLEKTIGDLNMRIRGDFAIIQFDDRQHYELAREKFVSFHFNDDSLSLVPYSEEQAQLVAQVPDIVASGEQGRKRRSNQSLQTIVSRLEDYNRKNEFLTIINNSVQNMAEYMCTFDAFLASIDHRLQPNPQPIKEDFQKEIKGYLRQRLSKIQKFIKNKFCSLNSTLRTFNSNNIDIDKVISFRTQGLPCFPPRGLRSYNHYLPKRKNPKKQVEESIRTIRALNEQEFVCSVNSRKEGSLRFYNIDSCEDYQCTTLLQNELVAGLLPIERHLLVGGSDSYFSYFSYNEPKFQEVSHQAFPKTWEIAEIVEVSRVSSGCKFVALGKWSEEKRAKRLFECVQPKDMVKLFYAQECKITEDASTLIFEEFCTITESAKISAIGYFSKTLAVAKQNNLECFDMDQGNKSSYNQKFQNEIFQIGRFGQDLLLLGQQNKVTLFDIRDQPLQNLKFDIKNEVRSVCCLGEFLFAYGSQSQVGVHDIRMPSRALWRESATHRGAEITDLAVVGSYLVSGDSDGQLSSWHSLPENH